MILDSHENSEKTPLTESQILSGIAHHLVHVARTQAQFGPKNSPTEPSIVDFLVQFLSKDPGIHLYPNTLRNVIFAKDSDSNDLTRIQLKERTAWTRRRFERCFPGTLISQGRGTSTHYSLKEEFGNLLTEANIRKGIEMAMREALGETDHSSVPSHDLFSLPPEIHLFGKTFQLQEILMSTLTEGSVPNPPPLTRPKDAITYQGLVLGIQDLLTDRNYLNIALELARASDSKEPMALTALEIGKKLGISGAVVGLQLADLKLMLTLHHLNITEYETRVRHNLKRGGVEFIPMPSYRLERPAETIHVGSELLLRAYAFELLKRLGGEPKKFEDFTVRLLQIFMGLAQGQWLSLIEQYAAIRRQNPIDQGRSDDQLNAAIKNAINYLENKSGKQKILLEEGGLRSPFKNHRLSPEFLKEVMLSDSLPVVILAIRERVKQMEPPLDLKQVDPELVSLANFSILGEEIPLPTIEMLREGLRQFIVAEKEKRESAAAQHREKEAQRRRDSKQVNAPVTLPIEPEPVEPALAEPTLAEPAPIQSKPKPKPKPKPKSEPRPALVVDSRPSQPTILPRKYKEKPLPVLPPIDLQTLLRPNFNPTQPYQLSQSAKNMRDNHSATDGEKGRRLFDPLINATFTVLRSPTDDPRYEMFAKNNFLSTNPSFVLVRTLGATCENGGRIYCIDSSLIEPAPEQLPEESTNGDGTHYNSDVGIYFTLGDIAPSLNRETSLSSTSRGVYLRSRGVGQGMGRNN